MKIIKILSRLFIIIFFVSCKAEPAHSNEIEYSNISFSNSKKSIGDILIGTSKEISFYAVNKSDVPLIIDSVKSSCACTVSKFPKEPILKNDSGLILAIYTPNKTNLGHLEKSVVVLSNTKPAFTVLTFSGTVVEE